MDALGFVSKVLFVILGVLLITIVIFVFFASCINNRTSKRTMEISETPNHDLEQDNRPPKLFGGINTLRTKRAIELGGLSSIMKISKAFSRYYEQNDQLPQRYEWCDSIIWYFEEENLVRRYYFNIPQLGTTEYHFAFNKNLSLLPKKGLPGNLVLVFEADGEFNLSGGPELLKKEHAKDKYFSAESRYVYILFLDGTVAKYRMHDEAISLAKKMVYEMFDYSDFGYTYEEEKAFSEYHKKGETPYSPLKWKP